MKEKELKVVKNARVTFESVSTIGLDFFYSFTPIAAPAAPATMFGFNSYAGAIASGMPHEAALIIACCAAFGLEGAGMMGFKSLIINAEKVRDGNYDLKFWLSGVAVVGYGGIGIGTALLDHVTHTMRVMTIFMFGITFLAYMCLELMKGSLKEQARDAENNAIKREDRLETVRYNRDKKKVRDEAELQDALAERQHKRDMERLRLEKQAQPQLVAMQSAPAVTTPEIKLRDYRRWQDIRNNPEAVKWINESTVEEIMAECPNVKSGKKTIKAWKNHAEKLLNE